MTLKRTN